MSLHALTLNAVLEMCYDLYTETHAACLAIVVECSVDGIKYKGFALLQSLSIIFRS